MCADQAPRPRGRGGLGRGRIHTRQVVDPADIVSSLPMRMVGGSCRPEGSMFGEDFPLRSGNHTGARVALYFPAGARGEAGWQPARKRWGAIVSAMSCRMGPVSGSFLSWTPFRRLFCFARRPSAEFSAAGQVPRTTSGCRGSNSGDAAADIRFHTRSRRPCATWAGWKRSAARPPSAAGASAKSGPATPRPSGDRRDLARRAERSPASGPRQEPEGLPPRRLSAAPPARPEILRRTPPRARRRPDAARLRDRSGARPVTALGDYPSLPRRAIQPHWMPPVLEGAACRQ